MRTSYGSIIIDSTHWNISGHYSLFNSANLLTIQFKTVDQYILHTARNSMVCNCGLFTLTWYKHSQDIKTFVIDCQSNGYIS